MPGIQYHFLSETSRKTSIYCYSVTLPTVTDNKSLHQGLQVKALGLLNFLGSSEELFLSISRLYNSFISFLLPLPFP